jgi:predicted lipid-binding transport protein (Tim44 family)
MAARTGNLQYADSAAAASSGTFGSPEKQAPPLPAAAPTPVAERIEPTLEPIPGPGTANVPPGFAVEPFVEEARRQFQRLQAAFDQDDRVAMARLMTPELFAEVVADRASRTAQFSTEIVALNVELLEVVTEGDRHWASVRYRGVLREDHATLPRPFDEIWNLAKPVNGTMGWLLAGIQQVEPGAPTVAEGISA